MMSMLLPIPAGWPAFSDVYRHSFGFAGLWYFQASVPAACDVLKKIERNWRVNRTRRGIDGIFAGWRSGGDGRRLRNRESLGTAASGGGGGACPGGRRREGTEGNEGVAGERQSGGHDACAERGGRERSASV